MFRAVLSYHSTQLLVSVLVLLPNGCLALRAREQRREEVGAGVEPQEWGTDRNFGAKCGFLCLGLSPQALRGYSRGSGIPVRGAGGG